MAKNETKKNTLFECEWIKKSMIDEEYLTKGYPVKVGVNDEGQDVIFFVMPESVDNKEYIALRAIKFEEYLSSKPENPTQADFMSKYGDEIQARTIVIGWEGIEEEYTPEMGMIFAKKVPNLWQFAVHHARQFDDMTVYAKEKIAKN